MSKKETIPGIVPASANNTPNRKRKMIADTPVVENITLQAVIEPKVSKKTRASKVASVQPVAVTLTPVQHQTSVQLGLSFNVVYNTMRYDFFHRLETNRDLDATRWTRLISKFKEQYLISPVVVNQDMYILDGQHRVHAAQLEGIPVNFIVVEDNDSDQTVRVLNSTMKRWNNDDFLNCYKNDSDPEIQAIYQIFYDFKREYQLTNNIAEQLLRLDNKTRTKSVTVNGVRVHDMSFRSGKFKIKNLSESITFAKNITNISEYSSDRLTDRNLILALIAMFKHPHYNHQRFMSNLERNSSLLNVKQLNQSSYASVLEHLYNMNERSNFISLVAPTDRKFVNVMGEAVTA